MSSFETFLCENGYVQYEETKEGFKKSTKHVISAMGVPYYYYTKKKSNLTNGFKSVILFGLSEYKKPPTLIKPRPRIEMTRIRNGESSIETENDSDNAMNIVLSKFTHTEILDAMFDQTKVLTFTIDEKN